MAKPIRINVLQNTSEWLELRYQKIGASEAAVILGVNPWKSPYKLWKQKLDKTQDPVNAAMQKGKDLEPVALAMFNEQMEMNCKPEVFEHAGIPYMLASLDGWDEATGTAVEIKCGGFATYDKALSGIIPEYYKAQMQHTMEVMGIQSMYYAVYFEGELKIIQVDRDPEMIKDIILKEAEFWTYVVDLIEPPKTIKDYAFIEDPKFIKTKNEYAQVLKSIESLEHDKSRLRDELIDFTDGLSCEAPGIKIRKCEDSVSYDYKKCCEDLIDKEVLEKYKKTRPGTWRITLDKENT